MKFLENNTLVAIMKSAIDFEIAKNDNWYRIPIDSAPSIVRDNKLKYISFYHTSIFDNEKFSIRWYSKVKNIEIVERRELFPKEPINVKTNKKYYKINYQNLKPLSNPIMSHRCRRIIFIPTHLYKLIYAREINDIFNNSPLDNMLWKTFIKNGIAAERDYFIEVNDKNFCLDFAIFCKKGNINVECDGDEYHTKKDDVQNDKRRNNMLESKGWSILRFTTDDIIKDMRGSLSLVQETIIQYGGSKYKIL